MSDSLTIHWLKEKIAELEQARSKIPFALGSDENKTLLAFKHALASLDGKPVAIVDIQHGRADGNTFACTFTQKGHALKDDVYMLFTNASPAGAVRGDPVYQMRMLNNSADAETWVEVSELEINTPLNGPLLWEKRVLFAFPYIEPLAPDPAFLDEARICAFALAQIGSIEAHDIDSDHIELRFEMNGVDTGSDISITDYASRSADVISRFLSVLSCNISDNVTCHADNQAFDRFATACKAKLEKSRAKGRSGWNNPEQCSDELLAKLLVGHLLKGNAGTFEDVATFAMMLHQRGADPQVLADAAKLVINNN